MGSSNCPLFSLFRVIKSDSMPPRWHHPGTWRDLSEKKGVVPEKGHPRIRVRLRQSRMEPWVPSGSPPVGTFPSGELPYGNSSSGDFSECLPLIEEDLSGVGVWAAVGLTNHCGLGASNLDVSKAFEKEALILFNLRQRSSMAERVLVLSPPFYSTKLVLVDLS